MAEPTGDSDPFTKARMEPLLEALGRLLERDGAAFALFVEGRYAVCCAGRGCGRSRDAVLGMARRFEAVSDALGETIEEVEPGPPALN